MRALACGRFDFKGTTDMDTELHFLVQDLKVPAPNTGLRLNERLSGILTALGQRAEPTLLIFDTYERAGQAQKEWVDRVLLARLMGEDWLRVVIAGKEVPSRTGAVWATVARTLIELAPPPLEAWHEFGQPYTPDLTLDQVREVHERCGGAAHHLAEVLCPEG